MSSKGDDGGEGKGDGADDGTRGRFKRSLGGECIERS